MWFRSGARCVLGRREVQLKLPFFNHCDAYCREVRQGEWAGRRDDRGGTDEDLLADGPDQRNCRAFALQFRAKVAPARGVTTPPTWAVLAQAIGTHGRSSAIAAGQIGQYRCTVILIG